MILSPSLLSADFARLGDVCQELEEAGIPWLHLDVIDGAFAPNITFGQPVIKSLRTMSRKLFFDVHIMAETPSRYVQSFADAGADLIVIHAEAETHLQRALCAIREAGCRAGVAFNPSTDPACLRWLADDVDLVLLMSVNPGFSGQKFIPSLLPKLRYVRGLLDEHSAETVPIEVDGGVCPENVASLVGAGADVFVSGSAFFKFPPFGERHKAFAHAAGKASGIGSRPALAHVRQWKSRRG